MEPLLNVLAAGPSAGNIDGKRAKYALVFSMALIPEFESTEGPIVVPPQPFALIPGNTEEEIRAKVMEVLDFIFSNKERPDATVVTDTST